MPVTGMREPRAHPRDHIPGLDRSGVQEGTGRRHAAAEAPDVLALEANVHAVPHAPENEAEKGHGVGRPVKARLDRVKAKAKAVCSVLDCGEGVAQAARVVVEDEEVVAVANERAKPERRPEQVVHRRQEDVGPDLRRERPDREAVRPLERSEEVVAGKVPRDALAAYGGVEERIAQPSEIGRREGVKQASEDGMVDGRKELAHVDAKDKLLTPREIDRAPEAAVGAFACAASVALGSEPAFERGQGRGVSLDA